MERFKSLIHGNNGHGYLFTDNGEEWFDSLAARETYFMTGAALCMWQDGFGVGVVGYFCWSVCSVLEDVDY